MDLPGEKLVIKLWETLVDKGIGSLLTPWQIKRVGDARLEVRKQNILVLAQAEEYAEQIRSGRMLLDSKGVLQHLQNLRQDTQSLPNTVPIPDEILRAKAAKFLVADGLRREVNVARAVIHAEAQLAADLQESPTTDINDDWLFRWRDYAGEVSREELQNLWGRVLAGELKSPGAFSLRTLDFIRNLSQTDAADIAKLASFVVEGVIFLCNELLMDAGGLTLSFMLNMQDMGILSGVGIDRLQTEWTRPDPSKEFILCGHKKALVLSHVKPTTPLRLRTCKLTQLGIELMHLGNFEDSDDCLKSLATHIAQQGFTVRLANYVTITGDTRQYFNLQQL